MCRVNPVRNRASCGNQRTCAFFDNYYPFPYYTKHVADERSGKSILIGSTSKTILKPRLNNQITAPRLRVVDAEGNNVGVMSREEALALARPEEGLDLIEVTAQADPPVARLMSFDKYRYLREKEEKKQRQAQKSNTAKQIQISARAAQHDLLMKVRQLDEFLNENHHVEIQMRLRGREKANKDWAMQKLNGFLKMITVEYRQLVPPKFGGRGVYMQIVKK